MTTATKPAGGRFVACRLNLKYSEGIAVQADTSREPNRKPSGITPDTV